MLEKVKVALRKVKVDAFDEEIKDIIAAARTDLVLAGVAKAKAKDDTDPLIIRAVILYAKAQFGYIENAAGFGRSHLPTGKPVIENHSHCFYTERL